MSTPVDVPERPVDAPESDGAYDYAKRRRTTRRRRERGRSVYIPAAELRAAGYDPDDDLWYRVWGTSRGVVIRIYREP